MLTQQFFASDMDIYLLVPPEKSTLIPEIELPNMYGSSGNNEVAPHLLANVNIYSTSLLNSGKTH